MGQRWWTQDDQAATTEPRVRLEHLPVAALIVDASGRVCDWNGALARLTGRDGGRLDRARVTDVLGRDLVWAPSGGTSESVDVVVRRHDGTVRHVRAHAGGLDGQALGRTLIVLVEREATPSSPELRAPRIIQWSEFTERLRPLGDAVCATFGLVGLDAVNASYSRSTGDHVLTRIAERLVELAPDDAVVARTGGERFVVAVPESAVADGVWADIVVQLRAPVDTPLGRVAVGSSVGVATGDTRSGLVLLDASERRLDSALQRGAGIVEEQRTIDRVPTPSARYSGELVEAVAAGGVRAHFQPVVDLLDSRVVEFEALARWDGDDDVRREASEFIAAAADTGVIVSMGVGVLHDAVELARSVSTTIGDRSFVVSVNVSLRELLDVDFLGLVHEHLRRSGICPATLQIEVGAEVPLEDTRDVAVRIAAIRELGVRVALDNVGGPGSSLLVLRDLVSDVIKLDPSLVGGLGADGRAEHLLRSLLELGRHLGVVVVAKGVERSDQHELLRSLGCRYAQGFHYGAATPALELPFDQLVGPPAGEHRPHAPAGADIVAVLIAHGAFDHAVLDGLVAEAARETSASTAFVAVAEGTGCWIASSGGPADGWSASLRGVCAEVVATGRAVVPEWCSTDADPGEAGTDHDIVDRNDGDAGGWVALPVRVCGTVTVAALCVVWADGVDAGPADGAAIERLRGVAEEIGARLEVRARLAGADIGPTDSAAPVTAASTTVAAPAALGEVLVG